MFAFYIYTYINSAKCVCVYAKYIRFKILKPEVN